MTDADLTPADKGIARQQWRARIETSSWRVCAALTDCIARQQWRARIETALAVIDVYRVIASPASNGGRGLKPSTQADPLHTRHASPASNGGRGLKRPSNTIKVDG